MRNNRIKSYMMLITSMLIFGTIGIFRRYIPLSSAMLAFSRGILGSVCLILFIMLKKHKLPKIEKKTLFLLIITGALIGLNWILLFEAYNYTSVAIATMCYYMQPTIVILLSPLVLREKLAMKKLLCAATAIVGMIFISGMLEGNGVGTKDTMGILCGLGAASLYATVVILNKKIQIEDAYQKTIIQLSSAAAVLIPYLFITENLSEIKLDVLAILMVLVVGIVHTGIAYALYFGSMKNLKSQSIAVLSYIDPVFALLLSAVVLSEKLTVFGVIGAVLIIGSAMISELGNKEN